MAKRRVELIEFAGIVKDVPGQKLPDKFFQEDEGGNRYAPGVWRRRKGMLHTDAAAFSSAVTAIIGFNLPGGDTATLIVEGTNAQGETNLTTQTDSFTGPGFGEGGFGAGGFGS